MAKLKTFDYFALGFFLLASGCNSSTATYTGSCSNYTTSTSHLVCIDYYGGSSTQVQTLCSGSLGTTATFGSTKCTTTSKVGTCNTSNQAPTYYWISNYYTPQDTATSAQSDCATNKVNGVSPTFTSP